MAGAAWDLGRLEEAAVSLEASEGSAIRANGCQREFRENSQGRLLARRFGWRRESLSMQFSGRIVLAGGLEAI